MAVSATPEAAGAADFKPLEAYGLIGDSRSAALVGADGAIDWLCLPDFDSPAAFAALLDPAAGSCAIHPAGRYTSRQYYEPGTNILCTEFECARGTLRLRDFMPVVPERRLPTPEIHRKLEVVSGEVEVEVRFEPRFDYGRQDTRIEITRYGAAAHDGDRRQMGLVLTTELPLEKTARGAAGCCTLKAGDNRWAVLSWQGSTLHPTASYRSEQRIRLTRRFWRDWIARLRYHGDYRTAVERSLLTLKLLTYSASGAVVAAPTTSLPEWAGGGRNWDYRYTWVRDSSFMLRALFAAGFVEEGTAYFDWLLKRCSEEEDDLHVLYSIHGRTDLKEYVLPLRGWRDSAPVRIGNEAVGQFQLDIYGSLIDAALSYHDSGGVLTVKEAQIVVELVERVRLKWRLPDDGIWEARSGRKHYTYSKIWAWVALARGAELVRKLHLDVPHEDWLREAEELRNEVLVRAYNPALRAFVQYYDGDVLDAAVLAMPITGIIAADDPRFESTREALVRQLGAGRYPLLYRYDSRKSDDGVGGREGAFLLPSFWLVEGLSLAGRQREAQAAFASLLKYASPLGLFSEQVNPEDGTLLGNYPQGFSHLGVVNAALRLAQTEME